MIGPAFHVEDEDLLVIDLPEKGLSLACSPNGKWIAAGLSGGKICIFDANSGKQQAVFVNCDNGSASWSPSGNWLALGRKGEGQIALIEVGTWRETRTLKTRSSSSGTGQATFSFAWNGDGSQLIACTSHRVIECWTAAGETLPPFDTGYMVIDRIAWCPETGQFVSQDPIGFAAGDANLYCYVGNNPVNAIDPSGLEELNQDRSRWSRDIFFDAKPHNLPSDPITANWDHFRNREQQRRDRRQAEDNAARAKRFKKALEDAGLWDDYQRVLSQAVGRRNLQSVQDWDMQRWYRESITAAAEKGTPHCMKKLTYGTCKYMQISTLTDDLGVKTSAL